MKRPVFVVGCPRSGTTWFYHLLLSAGGFAIFRTEAKVFTYLAPLYGHFRTPAQREKFLAKWLQSEDFFRSGLDAEPLKRRIRDECRSAGDCQRILMESIAREQGAERWSDCTPDNLLVMEEIQRSFPDALFIHMVRDGRDVALSLSRQNWIQPLPWDKRKPALPAALYWEWAVGCGRASGRRLGNAYLEVRYEDLVQAEREVLGRVSEFIGQVLDNDRIQRKAIGSVSRPNTSFGKESRVGGFQPVKRWKALSSEEELCAMEALIGPRLRELGYQPATTAADGPPTFALRASRALYRARFGTRLWLKLRTPLGQRFADSALLDWRPELDISDRTLRPGTHKDFIRRLVKGSDLPD